MEMKLTQQLSDTQIDSDREREREREKDMQKQEHYTERHMHR